MCRTTTAHADVAIRRKAIASDAQERVLAGVDQRRGHTQLQDVEGHAHPHAAAFTTQRERVDPGRGCRQERARPVEDVAIAIGGQDGAGNESGGADRERDRLVWLPTVRIDQERAGSPGRQTGATQVDRRDVERRSLNYTACLPDRTDAIRARIRGELALERYVPAIVGRHEGRGERTGHTHGLADLVPVASEIQGLRSTPLHLAWADD